MLKKVIIQYIDVSLFCYLFLLLRKVRTDGRLFILIRFNNFELADKHQTERCIRFI